MSINARVMELIDSAGISKSELAIRLDVSLAQLSHISSGRNKPGLELIQKLLIEFPSINPLWLINGAGEKLQKPSISNEISHFMDYAEQKLRSLQLELKEMELKLRESRQNSR